MRRQPEKPIRRNSPPSSSAGQRVISRSGSVFDRTLRALVFTALMNTFLPGVLNASGRGDPSNICDRVAVEAAAATGVPLSVLKAITLTETGRARNGVTRPWPWTVNMEGKGVWFDSNDAAQAYAYEHYKRGARSFDVGCFQINYKWHHEAFTSLQEMFDPMANALYAARYLTNLYQEMGTWEDAAGAYHSRTPEYADRYKARFAQFRAGLQHEDGLPLVASADRGMTGGSYQLTPTSGDGPTSASGQGLPAPVARVRVNTFPLLQSGGKTSLGSLVPLSSGGGAASLFASPDAG